MRTLLCTLSILLALTALTACKTGDKAETTAASTSEASTAADDWSALYRP